MGIDLSGNQVAGDDATRAAVDDDQVEITDLDSQNDGFSSSLSLLLHNPGNKAGLLVILSTAMLH